LLAAERRARLLEAAGEQDEDGLEAALAVQVAPVAALLVRERALQERGPREHRGVPDDPRVRGVRDAGGGAGQRRGAEDGRADLTGVVLVAAVALEEKALAGAEVEVQLEHPVPAVGLGRDAEVLAASGGGRAAGDEGGDLGAVDVHASFLVQLLEGAE